MKDLEVRDPVPPTKRVHKLVLTGGPCGGKTTGQARLSSFFENLGWKAGLNILLFFNGKSGELGLCWDLIT